MATIDAGRRRTKVIGLTAGDISVEGETAFHSYRGKGNKRGRRELPKPAHAALCATLADAGVSLATMDRGRTALDPGGVGVSWPVQAGLVGCECAFTFALDTWPRGAENSPRRSQLRRDALTPARRARCLVPTEYRLTASRGRRRRDACQGSISWTVLRSRGNPDTRRDAWAERRFNPD